jgi:prepilin-type N-terminal cleavage/methylation domain-containing protein
MNSTSLISKRFNPSLIRGGFTLIEVMIALFVLVMIGTTTSKAVIDAAKLKEVLKDETEFSSEFRTSVGFIERDLAQIFNPRWFLSEELKPIEWNGPQPTPAAGGPPILSNDEIMRRTRGTASQNFEYWGAIYEASGIRPSRFRGKDHEMSFVAASHVRVYQMKKESIYAKVHYELIKQPPNPNLSQEENAKNASLFALVKVENPRAFELEEPRDAPYVNRYVILNNIKKFTFTYYKRDDKSGQRDWDSETAEPKGSFPAAVGMELTLVGPKERVIDEKVYFNLETPNEVLPKTY